MTGTGFQRGVVLAAGLWLGAAMPAVHPALAEPMASTRSRLVRQFDFEEGKDGNFEDLPMSWYRIGAPPRHGDPAFARLPLHQQLIHAQGFPPYTQVRFDQPQHQAGNHSLYLAMDGAQAGAFLEIGAVPAVPGSDYLVTARVRGRHLDAGVARLTAYFVDSRGLRIDDSLTDARFRDESGQWQTITLRLPGNHRDAAWIGLQAELLQAAQDPSSPLGQHQIVLTDVDGQAWFDDVAIWQLPSISVQTQSRVNILRAPTQPKLTLAIRDLTGQPLDALTTVYDHRMNRVMTHRQQLGAGAGATWSFTPELPGFGWYLADLLVRDARVAVTDPDAIVARALTTFLWLEPTTEAPSLHEAGRFTLDATGLPDDEVVLLPEVIESLQLGGVTLSAWQPDTTAEVLEVRMNLLDRVAGGLLGRGRSVAMNLSPLPTVLLDGREVSDGAPLPASAEAVAKWEPLLRPMLLRLGQRISTWQLGRPDVAESCFLPDLAGRLSRIRTELRRFSPQPELVLPWRIDQERDPAVSGADEVVMYVSPHVPPQRIPQYLAAWQGADAPPIRAELVLTPATEMDHPERMIDLALRMIHAWDGGVRGLTLSVPWTPSRLAGLNLLPDPALGVWTSVAGRLAGRRVVGRFDLGKGLPCLILDGERGGMLVAWNEQASPEDARADLYLAPSPVLSDIWGNRQPVPLRDGRHQLTLGTAPIFVEGCDTELALLRSSFAVDPAFIESRQTVHPRTIVLRNPWPRTLTGSLTVVEPERWRVSPQRVSFSIAAGETYRIPIELSFPASEVAGPKRLAVEADFSSVQHYQVRLTAPLQLGLPDIQFDANLATETSDAGRHDAVITMLIVNHGEQPVSLQAFAFLPGQPRQERLISGLKAGQSIIRRIRFTNVLPAGLGTSEQAVRVGLREVNGSAVLNDILWIR